MKKVPWNIIIPYINLNTEQLVIVKLIQNGSLYVVQSLTKCSGLQSGFFRVVIQQDQRTSLGKRFPLPEVRKSMLWTIADTKQHGVNLIKIVKSISFSVCFQRVYRSSKWKVPLSILNGLIKNDNSLCSDFKLYRKSESYCLFPNFWRIKTHDILCKISVYTRKRKQLVHKL